MARHPVHFRSSIDSLMRTNCPGLKIDPVCVSYLEKVIVTVHSELFLLIEFYYKKTKGTECWYSIVKKCVHEIVPDTDLSTRMMTDAMKLLDLYLSGCLRKPPRVSEINMAEGVLNAASFKPAVSSICTEFYPGTSFDINMKNYLSHVLCQVGCHLARITSRNCMQENLQEIGENDLDMMIRNTLTGHLTGHAAYNGQKAVLNYVNGFLPYDRRGETQTQGVKRSGQKDLNPGKKSSKRRKRSTDNNPNAEPLKTSIFQPMVSEIKKAVFRDEEVTVEKEGVKNTGKYLEEICKAVMSTCINASSKELGQNEILAAVRQIFSSNLADHAIAYAIESTA